MTAEIPFHRVELVGTELDAVRTALASGHTGAFGPFADRVGALLREAHDAPEVILTTSGTDALEMAALLLDLGPGDKVIVPSFTFVSSALAFARTGAEIVFADIEPVTLGIDPASVASLVDDQVRVVVPVHYAGVGCRIQELADVIPDSVVIVEDNAQGLFGSIDGQPLGTFGRSSAVSFHQSKNLIAGEGGALIVNDPGDVDRAHVLSEKGTDRRAFFQGAVDKYTWRDTGSSFGMSDVLAAILWAQLEGRESIQNRRRALYERYQRLIGEWADDVGVATPVIPEGHTPSYHLYHLLLPDQATRDRVIHDLRVQGIGTAFHYVPLHDAPAAPHFASQAYDCPVSTDVAGRLLRLPFYPSLTEAESLRVVETLADTFGV